MILQGIEIPTELGTAIAEAVNRHYRASPASPVTVQQVLAALALSVAAVIRGTEAQAPLVRIWFDQAVDDADRQLEPTTPETRQ